MPSYWVTAEIAFRIKAENADDAFDNVYAMLDRATGDIDSEWEITNVESA